MALVAAMAAAAANKHSATASEVAAYTARLQLLQVALHQSAKAVVTSSSSASQQNRQSSRGETEVYVWS